MSELDPVYLIAGSDRPKVDLAVQRLRGRFDPSSIERFDAATESVEDVVAACNTGSLFGGDRLVLVTSVDGRPGDDGRLRVTWKAAELPELTAYVKAPAGGTVLCLVTSAAVKKDAPLLKAVGKHVTVLSYDAAKSVGPWITERFKARGVPVEPEAIALLQHLVGSDLQALAQEIDKLILWSAGEPVTEEIVELLVTSFEETPPFALTDAWGARNAAAAVEVMEQTFARSHRTRRDEAARLSGTLVGHLGRLRKMKDAAAQGERPRDTATRLKMHPFYAEKLSRQAEGFADAELDDASVELARLDHAIKGGSRLSESLELQRALARIAREAGR